VHVAPMSVGSLFRGGVGGEAGDTSEGDIQCEEAREKFIELKVKEGMCLCSFCK
jgi:hypothetical protein